MNKISKTEIFIMLIKEKWGNPNNVLVVGCGKGEETLAFKRVLRGEVIGIDTNPNFDPGISKEVKLIRGDATNMAFKDEEFELVYSFHALEHIIDYRKALLEIKRVLKNDGIFFVGVPNKKRILGYIDSTNTKLLNKIKWNLADYKARLQGKFENLEGAHAGFYQEELRKELSRYFSRVVSLRSEYYSIKYSRFRALIHCINKIGLGNYLFPANYFLCIK